MQKVGEVVVGLIVIAFLAAMFAPEGFGRFLAIFVPKEGAVKVRFNRLLVWFTNSRRRKFNGVDPTP